MERFCWNGCGQVVLDERELIDLGGEDDPWSRPICWRCLLEWRQITPELAAEIEAAQLADLVSLREELAA